MIVLDTDHLSIEDRDTVEAFNLGRRLAAISPVEVFVTIITYEEQMRGWLAFSARAKTLAGQVRAFDKLGKHLSRFCEIPIVPFDDRAAEIFDRLRKSGIRIGTPDLRIASIVLANDAILLTRNVRDFERVPDLQFEDWTVWNASGDIPFYLKAQMYNEVWREPHCMLRRFDRWP
jgi:tRNA(fMet)-specific endonuclease VapC